MNAPGVGERAVSGSAGPAGEPERRSATETRGVRPLLHPAGSAHPWGWRAIIAFEASSIGWSAGRKVPAIRERFGVSLATYTLALVRAIDRPEALVEFPQLVTRLQRLRDERRSLRTSERVRPLRHRSDHGRQLSLGGLW